MKNCKQKFGVTLVEILVVVVVIAILAGMVIGLASRIDNQGKEQLVKNAFEILNCALEQFADYGYRYKDPLYAGFDFPLDCNGFDVDWLATTLSNAVGTPIAVIASAHDPNFSGSEAMYFFLSKVPESRQTLAKIDRSLITNKDYNKQDMSITIDKNPAVIGDEEVYPLMRVIDPWGKTLRYDYYDEISPNPDSKKTFPVLTSAGPDGIFDTADDISNRK